VQTESRWGVRHCSHYLHFTKGRQQAGAACAQLAILTAQPEFDHEPVHLSEDMPIANKAYITVANRSMSSSLTPKLAKPISCENCAN
jgi:hypothetical protein